MSKCTVGCEHERHKKNKAEESLGQEQGVFVRCTLVQTGQKACYSRAVHKLLFAPQALDRHVPTIAHGPVQVLRHKARRAKAAQAVSHLRQLPKPRQGVAFTKGVSLEETDRLPVRGKNKGGAGLVQALPCLRPV
jgi:hypothetical protein